ncbi:MAG: DUF4136 domain-containing protein [Mucilaginibacter sp.]
MKKLYMFYAGLLIACLWGCGSYQYYAIQSDKASFNKYRTFAWLPVPDSSRNYNDIADEKIKDEVTAGLEKRGLSLQTGEPDLLVRYTIQVKDRTRTYNYPTYVYRPGVAYVGVARNRYGRYFYYSIARPFPVYVGTDIVEATYKEGTLIIDLIERKNHQVIWRGYGVGDVDNPERAINDIPEVVENILKKLPITPLAPISRP